MYFSYYHNDQAVQRNGGEPEQNPQDHQLPFVGCLPEVKQDVAQAEESGQYEQASADQAAFGEQLGPVVVNISAFDLIALSWRC